MSTSGSSASRRPREEERRGQRMNAALKGFLVKRMKQLEEEARQSEGDNRLKSSVERVDPHQREVMIDTPSSLSESDDDQPKRKKAKSDNRKIRDRVSKDREDKEKRSNENLKKNNIQITIHRGRSRERLNSSDKDRSESRHDTHSRSRDSSRKRKDSRERRNRSSSQRSDRSRSKRSRSPRSNRSRSRSRSTSHDRQKRSIDRSERKRKKSDKSDKEKKRSKSKKAKKEKKHKKDGDEKKRKKKKKKKKKRLSDDDDNADYDENGEKIDYDFEEPNPEEFAEDGEVSEEDSSAEEKSDGEEEENGIKEDEVEAKSSDEKMEDTSSGESDLVTDQETSVPAESTKPDDLRNVIEHSRLSLSEPSCVTANSPETAPSFVPVSARTDSAPSKTEEPKRKSPLTAEDVFERDTNATKPAKPVIKVIKPNLGIKLSNTSETLIKNPTLSFDAKKKVFLEDGEVADSDDSKKCDKDGDDVKSSSSDVDINDLSSTGSLKDDDSSKKEKKKKKKKKERKYRKRKRSSSRSKSRSPKRSSRERKDSDNRRKDSDNRRKDSVDRRKDSDNRRKDSKDRRRSRSRHRSRSGDRDGQTVSRRRRSDSPSGRRRSRSPGRHAPGRWRSPSPRTRRRSRSPRPSRRSRSPAYYQWRKRADLAQDYRQRYGMRRSRTPVRERLGRRSRSSSLGIDKAALRAAAIRNTLEKQRRGKLEELGVNLSAADLSRIRSGANADPKDLTEFCRNLMRKPGEENDSDDEPTQVPVVSDLSEEEEGELSENKGGIQINIKNSRPMPILTPAERMVQSATLSKQFPVSSGTTHRKHESEWVPVEPKPPPPPKPKPLPKPAANMPKPKPELGSTLSGIAFSTTEHTDQPQTVAAAAQELALESVAEAQQPQGVDALPPTTIVPPEERIFPVQARPGNIADLVTQRLSAMKRAALNPNDVEAIAEIYDANKKIEEWTSSKVVPGQFLGSTDAKILTREELEGNRKNQCWARPDQFQSAQPVKGLGMFLLEKMGWKQGMGLGKNNEGPTQPLVYDLKNDRKGLISNEELVLKPSEHSRTKARPVRDLSEKHPISALMELCQRRKWPSPNFIEVMDEGPPHKRLFKFKVIVNGVEYQPTIGNKAKKPAKADAANVCLQALGLVPRLPL